MSTDSKASRRILSLLLAGAVLLGAWASPVFAVAADGEPPGAMPLGTSLANPTNSQIINVYKDSDYVDVSTGHTAYAVEDVPEIEIEFSGGLICTASLQAGQSVTNTVSLVPNAQDMVRMAVNPMILEVYHLSMPTFLQSLRTYSFRTVYGPGVEIHVPSGGGTQRVGVIGDKVAYSSSFYLVRWQYNMFYNANGGSNAPGPDNVEMGQQYIIAQSDSLTPPDSGQQFKEWNTDQNGGGTPYNPGDNITPSGDLILYAIWEPIPTYTLTLQAEAGGRITTGSSGAYAANVVISITATPYDGHTFDRWEASGGTFANINEASTTFTMPAAPATVTAHFKTTGGGTPNPATYTVRYDANNGAGTAPGPFTVEAGKTHIIEQPTSLTAPGGQQFKAWDTNQTGGGVSYRPGQTITVGGDLTLYAIWETIPQSSYTVTFDANGGSVTPASMNTGADGKLAYLPTPTRSGSYTFAGWYTAASGGAEVHADHVFTGDTTMYARWNDTSGSGTGNIGGGSTRSSGGSGGSSTPDNRTAKIRLPASAFSWDGRTLTINHDSITPLGLLSVQWDGATLTSKDYGVYQGSVIIRFGEDFMAGQSSGTHTIRVEFLGHTGETTVTVGAAGTIPDAGNNETHNPNTGGYPDGGYPGADNPNTGDGRRIWLALLLGSISGSALLFGRKYKKI